MSDRPTDIPLPEGWTWDRVEATRARWNIGDNMVPLVAVHGVVAWGTINSVRQEQLIDLSADDDGQGCTNEGGHEFVCTGTQYGGDDDSFHGEGRCYCVHCGADGDA